MNTTQVHGEHAELQPLLSHKHNPNNTSIKSVIRRHLFKKIIKLVVITKILQKYSVYTSPPFFFFSFVSRQHVTDTPSSSTIPAFIWSPDAPPPPPFPSLVPFPRALCHTRSSARAQREASPGENSEEKAEEKRESRPTELRFLLLAHLLIYSHTV